MSTQFTLRDLEGVIRPHMQRLERHAFLVNLQGTSTLQQLQRTLPRIAFFTLVFQDILRLARHHCVDPAFRAVAQSLERGDQGHDQWYLNDVERIGARVDAAWLFSKEQEVSRDVAYGLVSLVTGATQDSVRLAVLLSLEAMAAAFFQRISAVTRRLGMADELMYFGSAHVQAEKDHEVFTPEGEGALLLVIPEGSVAGAIEGVDATFRLMTRYADELAHSMVAAA